MTEYFRHLFHQPREIRVPSFRLPSEDASLSRPAAATTYIETYPQLDGIAFRSSKRAEGVNDTLFIEPDMCGDSAGVHSSIEALPRGQCRR